MTQDYPIYSPRKLIEVALPLDAINAACKREKSIRHGHPSTLHIWWARRPLAAARAVIFAQMVNDPGYQQGGGFKYGKNKKEAAIERKRLFDIIEDLVIWENTTNEVVLEKARAEIRRSWREVCDLNENHPQAAELFNPETLPGLHDPFAGGGSIPLEAQRLGLNAYASDLNPVAVLINKAMIEFPPKFAGRSPVNPETRSDNSLVETEWRGATGMAEDVRYYGEWMRDEAEKRIGHLYPKVEVTKQMTTERPELVPYQGRSLTAIAWIWARTVKSPNPAFSHVDVPLISTFLLGTKKGKEAYIQPVIDGDEYRFDIRDGKPPETAKLGTTVGKRKGFRCLMSGSPIAYDYIREQGKTVGLGERLIAVVAEGDRRRLYFPPTEEMEEIACNVSPSWRPDCKMPVKHRNFQAPVYGMWNIGDLFTSRQLVALTTFSDLIGEARDRIEIEAEAAGMAADSVSLEDGGNSARAYSEAISVYLAFALNRMVNYSSTICVWSSHAKDELVKQVFMRQAIPMTWDFAESNPFSNAGGTLITNIKYLTRCISNLTGTIQGFASQEDAANLNALSPVISTDPPYYDNVGYADLSDFFYCWLRRSVRQVYTKLFSTMAVPKAEELIASPYRQGGVKNAEAFFLTGMKATMHGLSEKAHPAYPVTIYYAFKQSETSQDSTSSTGWETFLEAVLDAGFALVGTWPMRTEYTGNLKKTFNALASSVVLVCRRRGTDAPTISRREFIRKLNEILPEALDEMTRGVGDEQSPVAPVDLSQAIIGPGMAVFSEFSAVLEADGEPMTVRTALQLINRFLAEDDFDKDTQFCLHWFEQYGWDEGLFGEANVLARAKATSVGGLADAGVIESGGGSVRLLRWSDYPSDWDPASDDRIPIWEALHHLIRGLKQGGESAAGQLLAGVQSQAEAARQLAYRLYTLCERKGWAEDAGAYNELITSWSGIETATPRVEQGKLF